MLNFKSMRFALLGVLFLISGAIQAQTVSGTVVDKAGDAVIGANVVVAEVPGKGAVTDVNGRFSIDGVSGNQSLRVTYVGYKTATVAARGQNIRIVLEENTDLLNDVVVVGYGVRRKSDVTGAVATVTSQDLETKPVNNPFEALQGKVAGVDITSSQRPGEIGSIRIRGVRSINATSEPLYVVDGVPLQNGGIESLNADDIENVSVLKDASATAIYGSRGANGVVLVTTKRGTAGKLHLNYSGSVTFENIVDKQPAMSASDYITWRRWAYYNSNPDLYTPGDQPTYAQDQAFFSGDPDALANVNKGWTNNNTEWNGSLVENTDWCDMVTRTGVSNQHTISASGGTEKMNAYVSFGYLNNKGTQKGQDFTRYNFTLTNDIQATPWFKMGGSVNASYSEQDYGFSRTGQVGTSSGPTDLYGAAKALLRYCVPYDENGDIINMPGGSVVNQYTVIDEWGKSHNSRESFRAIGSFYGKVDFGKMVDVLDGLSYKISFGPGFRQWRNGIFLSSQSANRVGGKNYASTSTRRYLSWTLDNQVDYNRIFGDHNIGVTLLQSASSYNFESSNESAQNIPNEHFEWHNMGSVDITDANTYGAGMGSGLTESSMNSYMVRLNYGFQDKYLLTASGRWDGSSVLAEGHKWAFFPSMALAWRADQEEFIKNIEWIDQLKVRVGVGTTGNSGVGPYGTLGNIQSFFVPFGAEAVQAYATNEPYYTNSQVGMANKELGWEKTTQWNFGVDYSFFRGRLGGGIDFFTSRTKDLLLNMTIPTLTGFPNTMANVGETKNYGFDISIYGTPVDYKGFKWVSSINAGFVKDEIVELSNGKQDDIANAWFIGESIGVFYGYDNAGLWQAEDAEEMAKFNANGTKFTPGSVRPVDQNGDYKIDADDRVILGNRNPRWTAGWTNTFSYKGLELIVELYGRFKYMVSTGGEGQLGMYAQREIDYWRPDNTGAEWQKPVYSTAGGDSYSSLLGFKDASFIKVRNLSLGYTFPKSICSSIGIERLKVYIQGRNLGNLTSSIDYLDLDMNASYYNRGFTMGLQVGF